MADLVKIMFLGTMVVTALLSLLILADAVSAIPAGVIVSVMDDGAGTEDTCSVGFCSEDTPCCDGLSCNEGFCEGPAP